MALYPSQLPGHQVLTRIALIAALTLALRGVASAAEPDWILGPFLRPAASQPIITPRPEAAFHDPILQKPVHWEALHTFNPAAIVRNGKVVVLYRAEDASGATDIGMHTSRLGMAESTDGLHFVQSSGPVFYPDHDGEMLREWPGGVEDPRLVESEDGTYILTYTQWNRDTYRIGIATSPDLIHWHKFGPAFGLTGKYGALRYKSAGIVTRLSHDRLIAARIRGNYWMYWGEVQVRLATSTDLIHWTPVEDAKGEPVVLLAPRPGRFDSELPEVGPPPVLTANGIILLYNGKNAATESDPTLPPAVYSVGQALFARENPSRLVSRTDHPFLQPQMPWERSGQYAAGTTFAEGLVHFGRKWLLYYGCADSLVGVALSQR